MRGSNTQMSRDDGPGDTCCCLRAPATEGFLHLPPSPYFPHPSPPALPFELNIRGPLHVLMKIFSELHAAASFFFMEESIVLTGTVGMVKLLIPITMADQKTYESSL